MFEFLEGEKEEGEDEVEGVKLETTLCLEIRSEEEMVVLKEGALGRF